MIKKQKKVIWLVVALVAVVCGGLLFVAAAAGWFDSGKATIDAEYLSEAPDFMELSVDEYNNLVAEKKSFIVFIDQASCVTADRMEGFVQDFMKEKGVKVYKMMFQDMKETDLYERIRFYPSVAVISKGKLVGYLRADADEDAKAYNNYDDFKLWINQFLK